MRASKWPFVALVALVAVAVAVLGWQRRTASELRGEIARQLALDRERVRLTAENRRLIAAQATAEEVERLRAERAAVMQLQTQLEAMQRRTNEAAGRRPAAPEQAKAEPSLLKGRTVAFQLWKNVGQATPDAALETILWAAAGGDIDTLAGRLALDPEAGDLAAATFAQLPEAMRSEFATPERLIAVLAAKDVPLGAAAILKQDAAANDTKVLIQIFDARGTYKVAQFSLRAEGDRWRLMVPVNVVKRYAASLGSPLVTTMPLP